MKPRERGETGEQDLFCARLDQIIDMNHPLVKLASDRLRVPGARFGAIMRMGPAVHPCRRG